MTVKATVVGSNSARKNELCYYIIHFLSLPSSATQHTIHLDFSAYPVLCMKQYKDRKKYRKRILRNVTRRPVLDGTVPLLCPGVPPTCHRDVQISGFFGMARKFDRSKQVFP